MTTAIAPGAGQVRPGSLFQLAICLGVSGWLAGCTGTHTLYVDANGSDSNPGTRSEPLQTISRADALARPGYTIRVAPGTYHVSAPSAHSAGILTTRSGTADARIRFVSAVKGGARIVVSGTGITWHSKGDFVDIDGFDISGSGRHGIVASGRELKITNNTIHDLAISGGCTGAGGAAIDTNGPVGHVLIKDNTIRNIGVHMMGSCNTVQGIYIANAHNIVSNNVVSGVAAAGIQQWHGATASTIVNNTVFRCKVGILIGQGDSGTSPAGSENNYVANNIVYDNMTYGIVEGGVVGKNNRYVNNLVHASGTNVRVKGEVRGTISAEPGFVNYQPDGSGDYRVHSTSPAFRRGLQAGTPATGADAGVAANIGAY